MIRRLRNLWIKDFRPFAGPVDVPLDGDVVLVHGDNAAGKSSLLWAIEYALTGTVADLAELDDDYPRSLTHVHSSEDAAVRLEATLQNGREATFRAGDAKGRTHLEGDAARHFSQRCFLSQYRLSRLIDLYRQPDSESAEETLVAFVRKLLGLDVIDALLDGLHEAGDRRRLRKPVASFAKLDELLPMGRSRRSALARELEDLRKGIRSAIDDLGEDLGEHGNESFDRLSNSSGIPLTGALDEAEREARAQLQRLDTSEESKRLPRTDQVLKRAATLFGDHREVAPVKEDVEARLNQLEARQEELKGVLSPVVQQGRSSLDAPPAQDNNLSMELRELANGARDRRAAFGRRIERAREQQRRKGGLQAEQQALIEQLSLLEDINAEDLGRFDELVRVLNASLPLVDDDVCPVCERDFREVQRGSLADHLAARLRELTSEVDSFSRRHQKRSRLTVRLREVDAELDALDEGMQGDVAVDSAIEQAQRLDDLLSTIESVEAARTAWDSVVTELEGARESLRIAERVRQSRAEVAGQLRQTAIEWGVSPELDPAEMMVAVTATRDRLEAERATRRSHLQAILDQVDWIRSQTREHEEQSKRLHAVEESLFAAEAADQRVDEILKEVRGVRNEAAKVKQSLIDEVFSESLNIVWTDIFSRLARTEIFVPRLEAGVLPRGSLRAAIRATHSAAPPFEHLRSVLSAGNLNTAALSLFLSLHLVQEPDNLLILLDDPVQSMDDVHAMELSGLMNLIRNQLNRQIVIGVHERALFEYLANELAPMEEHQSLVLIEIHREGEQSSVSAQRIVGTGDNLARA